MTISARFLNADVRCTIIGNVKDKGVLYEYLLPTQHRFSAAGAHRSRVGLSQRLLRRFPDYHDEHALALFT